MIFIRERVLVLLAFLVYLVLVLYAFHLIGGEFSHVKGYQYASGFSYKTLFGALLVIIIACMLPLGERQVSHSIAWFVFYFHIIPAILFIDLVTAVTDFEYYYYVITIFLTFTVSSFLLRGKGKSLSGLKFSFSVSLSILLFFYLLCVFVFYKDIGFRVSVPSVFDVYGLRAEYKSRVTGLAGYVSIWGGYFFSPFLILLSLIFFKKKSYSLSIFMLLLALFFSYQVFAAAGFKSVAFMFFAVILYALYLTRFSGTSFGAGVTYVVLFLAAFSFLIYFVFGFDDMLLHWIRRSLILPGVNSAYFYEYELIVGFDDVKAAPRTISEYYYETLGSANTGVVGDGVAKFGIGLFWINIFILFFILKVVDFFVGRSSVLPAALFLPSAYAIANSSLTSVLLTYAMIFMIVFTFIFREDIESV